ncbi:class E basic helix-loop-helix protein 40-like [Gadus chalcogrammus]|uniref:class E basic helix-loop-helix protein 40-like n=1 Tax=Gadus chalcogrammus TaxID=1042646 RepID=UPI0024C4CF91|nr:class E basic helix-loop-helix protein 40-like [Gadus chalcogrammus]
MERVSSAPPPLLTAHTAADLGDMQGMDFPMYVYKSRRGMKRGEESKETYKLPHRLIEKKRRDRINECIAQLKDLLPEHLKLTTLGHLEKAVVLELTLKHVKALTSLLEQQQQKILTLQNGMQLDPAPAVGQQKAEELFRSGFHMCAKEMLQYVASWETEGDLTPANMINHLHQLATEVLQGPPRSPPPAPSPRPRPQDAPAAQQPHHQGAQKGAADGLPPPPGEGYGRNCVPVIQRAYPPGGSEQSGSDTDTDSGYGGELEKRPDYYLQEAGPLKRSAAERHGPASIKQEGGGPHRKRPRVESSEDESQSGAESSSSSSSSSSRSYMSVSPPPPLPPAPHPLCMPFYLLPPSAASYLPMLEKCWYSGTMPMLYPGMGAPGDRAAAPQHHRSSRGASPSPSHPQTPMDSPALLQALKLVPPLTLETKD